MDSLKPSYNNVHKSDLYELDNMNIGANAGSGDNVGTDITTDELSNKNDPPSYETLSPGIEIIEPTIVYNHGQYDPDHSYRISEDSFVTFSDKSLRAGFIRKVYLILTFQLLVTCVIIAIFQFVTPIKLWVQSNIIFYILSYVVFVVLCLVLICCSNVRRIYPGNFIALFMLTLALSYMTAAIACYHDTPVVLFGVGITALLCISITLFTLQTKIDFTVFNGILFVIFMIFIYSGLSCLIIAYTYGFDHIYLGVITGLVILVLGIYFIYHTQEVLGNSESQLSPEDYIEGALRLYLDIINLFLIIFYLFVDS